MTEQEFYEACAALLGTVYGCRPNPSLKDNHRTRWNNRQPGSGRFPGQGLIRVFGDDVQIAIRHPVALRTNVQGLEKALEAIAAALPTKRRIVRIVGLAQIDGGRMLLVRKRGATAYILPGGKPETGETDNQALMRECIEELGCAVDDAEPVGTFRDEASDNPGVDVEVMLYAGRLAGTPVVQAEIEEMQWVDMEDPHVQVAPSLKNIIFPVMLDRKRSLTQRPNPR